MSRASFVLKLARFLGVPVVLCSSYFTDERIARILAAHSRRLKENSSQH